jgi:gluconolactonase
MVENIQNGTVKPLSGDLYRLDGDRLIAVANRFTVSNGMAWTSDDRTLYFNDSDEHRIWKFDYDITSGALSNQRMFIDAKQNPSVGIRSNEFPDGMCIDSYDNLWIALWGGARVVKIDTKKGASSIASNAIEKRII